MIIRKATLQDFVAVVANGRSDLFRVLQIGDASKVAPVDKFSLVLVALFAYALLGDRPFVRDWFGISLVAAGVLALAFRR